jgi:hypothetical protein
MAVLAGIAASDAICGIRLGCLHRGEDHHGAEERCVQTGPCRALRPARRLDHKGRAGCPDSLMANT